MICYGYIFADIWSFSSPAHQSSSKNEGDKHGMYIAYAYFSYMTTTASPVKEFVFNIM